MEEVMMQNSAQEPEQPDFDQLLAANRDYQSAFDRKVGQALQTARAKWEREAGAQREQLTETLRRQADADAQARVAEREQSLELREAEFARRLRQVGVAERLTRSGLPASFAPWLTGDTEEECAERVAQFDGMFHTAIADAVRERMSGGAPAEPTPSPALDASTLKGMSPREINQRWSEIQQALSQHT